jgi:hypothetical protein
MSESAQLREVETVADDTLLSYGLLSEPVTFPGFFPAPLTFDFTVPGPGQAMTVVGYGGRLIPLLSNTTQDYGNETSWPGPALEATLVADPAAPELCNAVLAALGYPPMPPGGLYLFCGAPSSTAGDSGGGDDDDDAQPCAGTDAVLARRWSTCGFWFGLALPTHFRRVNALPAFWHR